MNHVKTITRSALVDLLAAVSRPMPIGIVALTDARPRKTGNPFHSVFKLSRVWPFVGADYGKAVNAQLTREGSPADFVPVSPRYTRISAALVQFAGTGTFAVPVQFRSHGPVQASSPRYFARTARLAPLRPVSKETVQPYLPAVSEPTRQLEAGIESPVVWRTYGVDSILRIAIAGEVYRVRA